MSDIPGREEQEEAFLFAREVALRRAMDKIKDMGGLSGDNITSQELYPVIIGMYSDAERVLKDLMKERGFSSGWSIEPEEYGTMIQAIFTAGFDSFADGAALPTQTMIGHLIAAHAVVISAMDAASSLDSLLNDGTMGQCLGGIDDVEYLMKKYKGGSL